MESPATSSNCSVRLYNFNLLSVKSLALHHKLKERRADTIEIHFIYSNRRLFNYADGHSGHRLLA
jgi:hypothetical protein